ncbi:alpha/beta hydrolase [Nocardia sp. IBHARD005]|uniref:alpha/beta hydrolase n=1 Tax=Nocardia sp. IBHARD005 TaxID=3457765 RepID=UPI0040593C93
MRLAETARVAVHNGWALTFGSGVEQQRATPSTVVSEQPHRLLRRFGDSADGAPVLMVPPPAASATCFDLRPSQSLAEFMLSTGRTPYLVDYGEMTYDDRHLGFEDWIDDIIPEAIRRVSTEHAGAPVDVVSWSLGGVLVLLTAAAHPDLPIRSVTTVGTPIDYSKLPSVTLFRSLGRFTGGAEITNLIRLAGGVPAPAVRAIFRGTALSREIRKPWFIARNLHKTETLARMEAIDRFVANMPAYPGRFYTQVWERLTVHNDLAKGVLHLGERRIRLADVGVRVLALGSDTDAITTSACARGIVDAMAGAVDVRFEIVPGSHLGSLAGPDARHGTWPLIEEFLDECAVRPLDVVAD